MMFLPSTGVVPLVVILMASRLSQHLWGNHPRAVYTLNNAVGTITQTDIQSFEHHFDGEGSYPTDQCVCDLGKGDTSSDWLSS